MSNATYFMQALLIKKAKKVKGSAPKKTAPKKAARSATKKADPKKPAPLVSGQIGQKEPVKKVELKKQLTKMK